MIHEYNISKLLKLVKYELLDMKRWVEYFWYWELMPMFGKDSPSNIVIVKIVDYYIIMMRNKRTYGYLPKSIDLDEVNFLKFYHTHLRWAKSIHAYVELPYDIRMNLYYTVTAANHSMLPKKYDNVFLSYEEANLHAVLSGIADDVLPLEDFSDSKFD